MGVAVERGEKMCGAKRKMWGNKMSKGEVLEVKKNLSCCGVEKEGLS